MTAYNDNLVGDGSVISPNSPGVQVHRRRVDLAAEAAKAGVSSFSSSDTLALLELPAGTFVVDTFVRVLEAEGATLTADFGITGTDADGFLDGVNLNATGYTRGVYASTLGGTGLAADPVVLTGFTGGKLITADSTLDMLFNNSSADNAVFDLFVLFVPLYTSPAHP